MPVSQKSDLYLAFGSGTISCYFLSNRKFHFLLLKKCSSMVAHSHEKKMSLRDRARRESFASETLCSYIIISLN
jgi:hypothetical protein